MGRGRIKVSKIYLMDALKFPIDWNIEDIKIDDKDKWSDTIEMIISGSDFPEYMDGQIRDCQIVIYKENIKFEVKVMEETK